MFSTLNTQTYSIQSNKINIWGNHTTTIVPSSPLFFSALKFITLNAFDNAKKQPQRSLQIMATMTETCEMGSPPATTFTSIPVLDLSLVESPATKPFFLSELRRALVIVGFFYLKNTPVSTDVQKAFVQKSKDLFDLPLEKKLEIDMINSKHFLGYSQMGCERTARKTDNREMFDVC